MRLGRSKSRGRRVDSRNSTLPTLASYRRCSTILGHCSSEGSTLRGGYRRVLRGNGTWGSIAFATNFDECPLECCQSELPLSSSLFHCFLLTRQRLPTVHSIGIRHFPCPSSRRIRDCDPIGDRSRRYWSRYRRFCPTNTVPTFPASELWYGSSVRGNRTWARYR